MYHYETLGDEKFQELCQALISIQFPTATCLPVGQPDGGRDALMHHYALGSVHGAKELVVFQVKYSKTPKGERSARDQILKLVRKEKSKVEQLKKLGLKHYILVTNVQGTAHLDRGSIDTVNAELSKFLDIDSSCWWRDDIDRRLDAASAVKWSYPEVLKATDLLEVLVRGQLGEDEERRRNAIRAYLTDQYEDDKELKFKQTDLRSTMTELFVDLPMSPKSFDSDKDGVIVPRMRRYLSRGFTDHFWEIDESLNAAEFLLKLGGQKTFPRILLEGAPGQGKSTVTQYVCQVLRMLMLDKHSELAALPKSIADFTARVPFRVDLRDLAKWLGGIDPFQSKFVTLDEKEPKSLEGYLAAQIRHASGGASFDVSDLMSIAKASHLFLALDGFDEVADVAMRNILVKEISKATNRLINMGGFSVHTIVTSRPAAFAKSVRFPSDQWSYFQLIPLERNHVDAYTEKWMRAKALNSNETQTLKDVLNEKLNEAHTQYLAKNPMQLTILLTLIYNRGSSLPERRTAMYDAYMDTFFNREAEKSDIVRENRDLLFDIHRYLAWKLQTGAEDGGDGSIEHQELRTTLFEYLDSQEEDTKIINGLFDGIIERVGALVSRVQETYEFEVQPLREYFAARHLYDTSPFPTVADEQHGAKLDRFRALVRNPYWSNVMRFYGGCFSKGEVSALVDELGLIASEGDSCQTSHPQMVALMLLADWVFSQYQPAVKRVIELICQKPHIRQLLAADQSGLVNWPPLHDRSGKKEFVDLLWNQFLADVCDDERKALSNALEQNTSEMFRVDKWVELRERMDENDWISIGSILGIFRADADTLQRALPDLHSARFVKSFIDAFQFDLVARKDETRECAEKLLLGGYYFHSLGLLKSTSQKSDLFWMAKILNTHQYKIAFIERINVPLHQAIDMRFVRGQRNKLLSIKPATTVSRKTRAIIDVYHTFLETPIFDLGMSSEPWSHFVESLRSVLGDCNAIDRISVIGAGVRARSDKGIDQPLNATTNLVGAVRHARMKSGALKWWCRTFETAKGSPDLLRYLLVFWVWATRRTLLALIEQVDSILRALPPDEWNELWQGVTQSLFLTTERQKLDQLGREELLRLERVSGRTATLLRYRLTDDASYNLVKPILNDSQSTKRELSSALSIVCHRCLQESQLSESTLGDIKELYTRGAVCHFAPFGHDKIGMHPDVAKKILEAVEDYPLPFIAIADYYLKAQIGETAPKLSDVAREESWFR